ncbi:MAG TPA: hypothetical protein VGF94_08475 [Kofleriaceae bacterium]|jgi:hypothetical protein
MRTPRKMVNELVLRQVHIRQFLGSRKLELWADGALVKTCRTPLEADAAIRRLLDIDDEQGAALGRELEQIASRL